MVVAGQSARQGNRPSAFETLALFVRRLTAALNEFLHLLRQRHRVRGHDKPIRSLRANNPA